MIYRLTTESIKESGRKDSEEQLEFRPDTLALLFGGEDFEIPYGSIDRLEIFTQKNSSFIDSISVYFERKECKGELPPEGQGWEKAGYGRICLMLVGYRGMKQIASELQKKLKPQTSVEIKELRRTKDGTKLLMYGIVIMFFAYVVAVVFLVNYFVIHH